MLAPLSFALAATLAGFSAFSFAELSARLPQSAGEAVYVHEGPRSRPLSTFVGLLVVLVGSVSCATLANGFAGYANDLVALPDWLLIVCVIAALGALAVWGISQSVAVAALITVIEVGGLVVVIFAAAVSADPASVVLPSREAMLHGGIWAGVLSGTILAFFAFIGFEDMVNAAEEVKDVTRTLPLAIILTLGISLIAYVLLALVAVIAVPTDLIAASDAPLTLIFSYATGWPAMPITVVGVLALLNGALIQIIMAARVLYGMAVQGQLPKPLGVVNARTRTPITATLLVTAFVLVLALWLPLVTLARATSLIALVIFAVVNVALIALKRREPNPPDIRVFPIWVPAAGFLASTAFALYEVAVLIGA